MSFRDDVAARVRWLVRNRPREQAESLREALTRLKEQIATYPAVGQELARRGDRSYRIVPISHQLPYLVWYYYDAADTSAPVWFAMLTHEAQDRDDFDPGRFER